MLLNLSNANEHLRLYQEGIQQAKEGLEIYEPLGHIVGQGRCSTQLARLLYVDGQLDAAAETASRTIPLLEDKEIFGACQCHFVLGTIYCSKGNRKEAIEHLEAALKLASLYDWHDEAF